MKKIFIALLFLTGIFQGYSQSAQDKLKIEEFGKSIFAITKTIDTVAVKKLLPSKSILTEYVNTSSMSEDAKKEFLDKIDGGLEQMHKEINANIRQVHLQTAENKIIWKTAKYSSTEIKYWPKPTEKTFMAIQVLVLFTDKEKTLGISTECIITTKGTLLIHKLKLLTD